MEQRPRIVHVFEFGSDMDANQWLHYSYTWSDFTDVLTWFFVNSLADAIRIFVGVILLTVSHITYSPCRSWRPHLWRHAVGTTRRNPWRVFELNVPRPWSIVCSGEYSECSVLSTLIWVYYCWTNYMVTPQQPHNKMHLLFCAGFAQGLRMTVPGMLAQEPWRVDF